MIEMNIDAMSEICIDLRKKENKLRGLCEELSGSVRKNKDLSAEEIREVARIICNIESDCKNFKKLINVTEKSLNLYRSCEKNFLLLVSDIEKSCSKNQDIGMNNLSIINKTMEKYHFNTGR